jgi:hypothetical protein
VLACSQTFGGRAAAAIAAARARVLSTRDCTIAARLAAE